jgi:hypothetical protein
MFIIQAIGLPDSQSVFPLPVYLSVCLSIFLNACLLCLDVSLSVCLLHLDVCLAINLYHQAPT